MMQWTVFSSAVAAASLMFGFATGAVAETVRPGPLSGVSPGSIDALRYIGEVENGEFRALGCGGAAWPLSLTTIQRQEARSVESGRLDLSPSEGSILVVEGIPNGGWIYEARVVETAGPAVSAFIQSFGLACARR